MNFPITPPVQPVRAVEESYGEKKGVNFAVKGPTDNKVKGLVLATISRAKGSALLPSATAPTEVIELLSALEPSLEMIGVPRRKKKVPLRRLWKRGIPVGLQKCKVHGWINAWIQFLLFLPGAGELLSFVPRKFEPFREFVDQYFLDREENFSPSSANGAFLVRCLMRHLSSSLFSPPAKVDLYEVLRLFMRELFSPFEPPFCPILPLRSEWHFLLHPEDGEDELLERLIRRAPPHLLVAIKRGEGIPFFCRFLKRQFFPEPGRCCYDLLAFIEGRYNGQEPPTYVTYVKVEGGWYQCEDEKISSLLSPHLEIPFQRGVLFYYRRLDFSR